MLGSRCYPSSRRAVAGRVLDLRSRKRLGRALLSSTTRIRRRGPRGFSAGTAVRRGPHSQRRRTRKSLLCPRPHCEPAGPPCSSTNLFEDNPIPSALRSLPRLTHRHERIARGVVWQRERFRGPGLSSPSLPAILSVSRMFRYFAVLEACSRVQNTLASRWGRVPLRNRRQG